MWNIICFMLCAIGAICLDAVGYGTMGIIMLVCMAGINLGCYAEDIKDQNKELKKELDTTNKKLDRLIKQLEK